MYESPFCKAMWSKWYASLENLSVLSCKNSCIERCIVAPCLDQSSAQYSGTNLQDSSRVSSRWFASLNDVCLVSFSGPMFLFQSDPELHRHIEGSGIPPFFALSWFITWFAHNVPELVQISRIFDALVASHPLMPLYLSAAVMQVLLGHTDLSCLQIFSPTFYSKSMAYQSIASLPLACIYK